MTVKFAEAPYTAREFFWNPGLGKQANKTHGTSNTADKPQEAQTFGTAINPGNTEASPAGSQLSRVALIFAGLRSFVGYVAAETELQMNRRTSATRGTYTRNCPAIYLINLGSFPVQNGGKVQTPDSHRRINEDTVFRVNTSCCI